MHLLKSGGIIPSQKSDKTDVLTPGSDAYIHKYSPARNQTKLCSDIENLLEKF